jgi:signal transduction histidine kinase
VAAASEYVNAWSQQTGVPVELSLPPAIELVTDAQRQLQRILQEALANVRKHARATRVRVVLDQDRDSVLSLRVSDDGVGFDPGAAAVSSGGRFGLKTMAERAASIGAKLAVSSRTGDGTTVEVTLPRAGGARREIENASALG